MSQHLFYPFYSEKKKIELLFSLCRHDAYLKNVMHSLDFIGYSFDFTFLGAPAAYYPKIIMLEENEKYYDLCHLRKDHDIKAEFSLSHRMGLSYHLHHLIHEIFHFEQDIHGLFGTPIMQKGQRCDILPLDDYTDNLMHLEAMAASQAIAASWRLKEKHDIPYAWRGCYYAVNWHKLSKIFKETILSGRSEAFATERLYQAWFDTIQCRYTKKMALKNHAHLVKISRDVAGHSKVPAFTH